VLTDTIVCNILLLLNIRGCVLVCLDKPMRILCTKNNKKQTKIWPIMAIYW